jgi:hypothetical protein
MLLCVGLVVVVGVLAGCGGAGNPGGNNLAVTAAGVTPAAAHDPALVGTWMLIWGTANGAAVAPANVEKWPAGTTRGLVVFKGTGTWVYTFYNAGGGVVGTQSGTWAAGGGLITTGENSGTYTVSGNALTFSGTDGGVTRVRHYVKIVSLTAHDPALVKTWTATGVWVNGVAKPLSYLTGDATFNKLARRFAADGTAQDYLLKSGLTQKVPKLAPKSWASGGGVLKLGTGPIAEGLYVLAAGQLTTWQLDALGNTVKIVFKPYGAAGAHDARLVGSWHPVSATVDGIPVPVKTALNLPTGVDNMPWIFWADGTLEWNFRAGTTLKEASLNTWFTSAAKLTITMPGSAPGTVETNVTPYSVPTSSSLRFAGTENGHAKVLVFAKDS